MIRSEGNWTNKSIRTVKKTLSAREKFLKSPMGKAMEKGRLRAYNYQKNIAVQKEINRINAAYKAGNMGGASAEYGQTLTTLALLPLVYPAASVLAPTLTTSTTGSFAANTAAKLTLRKGLLLGGTALAGTALLSFLGGQKQSQQQSMAPQNLAQEQQSDFTQQGKQDQGYSYAQPQTSGTFTAGGNIDVGEYGTTRSYGEYYEQGAIQAPSQGASEVQAATQEATQKSDMSFLMIIAIVAIAIMFLFGGKK